MLNGNLPSGIRREANGGVPVNIQDQTTKPVILNFNNVTNSTTLKADATKGAKTIDLASTTGSADGKYIIIFDPSSLNFSFYTQIGAAAVDTITLDSPLDFDYPAGSYVDLANIDMSVNGDVTPVTFGLRGAGSPPGVDLSVHITGINFFCIAATAVDLTKFADIAALTKGLILRKRDGTFQNIVNIKNNAMISAFSERFTITQATNPVQGEDGFYGSARFAGQDNLGVAINLNIGEDLEFIVQDDLTGITYLSISATGHVTQD
ncbi:MAG: hypothetical protein P8X74_03560 [Reinekea sp.]